MRGKRLRLVAGLCLAAFVVANACTSIVLAAHFDHPAPTTPGSPCAVHCHDEAAAHDDEAQPIGDCHCPHCPQTPCPPKCPCPGGCILCSVAKLPCLLAGASFDLSSPCLGESLTEPPLPYTPPFSGTLIRPPRA